MTSTKKHSSKNYQALMCCLLLLQLSNKTCIQFHLLAPDDVLKKTVKNLARQNKSRFELQTVLLFSLDTRQLPIAYETTDTEFIILVRLSATHHALIKRLSSLSPEVLRLLALQNTWAGQVIFLHNNISRFDISWFIPVFLKHKCLLYEVLFFYFMLQCLVLISPLVFHGVMDDVQVHHALSTRDVLVWVLVIVSLFEVILRRLREYMFSHTTNRIDIMLGIQAGKFIGITGPSDSGKSNQAQLLQRLYIPQHGQVMVDGIDLAIADPVSLRHNMSVVLQDCLLFSGSSEDNIRQCRSHALESEIIHFAELAGAHEFIPRLPEEYDTPVGEKSGCLSGSQRQLIALARALIIHPRILILDEATSALDYGSEAAVMSHLPEICKGRTVISIAHGLNTLRDAGQIRVMDKGNIVEEGGHEKLLQTHSGRYRRRCR